MATGEARRVATWKLLLGGGEDAALAVPLLAEHGRRARLPRLSEAAPLAAGHAALETLAWSPCSVARRLERLRPDVLVCVTARAYHPRLTRLAGTTVLDLVDSLARSYRDRAHLTRGWARLCFAVLGASHRRLEATTRNHGVRRVTAGWRDASDLGAEWLPNLMVPQQRRPSEEAATHDLIFFGNLSYPPNVDAVHRLSHLWPELQRRRPGTTAIVAGARPAPTVRRLAALHGWELIADFDDLGRVCGRARLAVAPLQHTAGIQNKVLDAAGMGMAQVVSPAAIEGFAPGFPITVAGDNASFASEVCRLLDDPVRRAQQGLAALAHVRDAYSVEAWRTWVTGLAASARSCMSCR